MPGAAVVEVDYLLQHPDIAGFFGKVTSRGDFVSRRLPSAFITAWDGWLQVGIEASRDHLGERWLATYLSSPLWRFALAPGVCDGHAWFGVLMPSVDRVGRHFPLTIAVSAPPSVSIMDWIEASAPWYAQLEALALSTLETGFALDEFDESVAVLKGPAGSARAVRSAAGMRFPIEDVAALASQRTAMDTTLAATALARHSLWWTNGSELVTPSMLVCLSLPHPRQFVGMLDGDWIARDWQNRPA